MPEIKEIVIEQREKVVTVLESENFIIKQVSERIIKTTILFLKEKSDLLDESINRIENNTLKRVSQVIVKCFGLISTIFIVFLEVAGALFFVIIAIVKTLFSIIIPVVNFLFSMVTYIIGSMVIFLLKIITDLFIFTWEVIENSFIFIWEIIRDLSIFIWDIIKIPFMLIILGLTIYLIYGY